MILRRIETQFAFVLDCKAQRTPYIIAGTL